MTRVICHFISLSLCVSVCVCSARTGPLGTHFLACTLLVYKGECRHVAQKTKSTYPNQPSEEPTRIWGSQRTSSKHQILVDQIFNRWTPPRDGPHVCRIHVTCTCACACACACTCTCACPTSMCMCMCISHVHVHAHAHANVHLNANHDPRPPSTEFRHSRLHAPRPRLSLQAPS